VPQLSGLAVLADAAARRDPRMRHVWVDVTAFARPGLSAADARRLVRRLRQVGMERVLYGSDAAIGADIRPRDAWAAFRTLPLTDAEAARVAKNVMPYLR
jgi:predicted TIM-barrel fold metal-dependent hydrolase